MNERQLRTQEESGTLRDRREIQPLALAAEVSGYCDMGMKRQALRLARKVFRKRRMSPEEFFEAVRTVGVHSNFKRFKADIEGAYERQSRRFKRKARPVMLDVYATLCDWGTAAHFVSVQNVSSAPEMFFSMDVLLALDKLEEAAHLAAKCKKALRLTTDRFHASLLIESLARFFARTHRWDEAVKAWEHAPLEEPLRRNTLSSIVQIHLARAFEAVDRGLEVLAELKQNPDMQNELCVPGNDLGMTQEAEKELLKFKRGIEKMLPEPVRQQLGMANNKLLE